MSVEMFRGGEHHPSPLTLEQVLKEAKSTALSRGRHAPTLILEGSGARLRTTLNDLPATHEGRARLLFRTGLLLAEAPALGELTQVFFVCEGWMSLATEGRPAVHPPSSDPNRREVLTIFRLQTAGHETEMALLEMRRGRQGRLVGLTDLEVRPPSEAGTERAESPLLEAFLAGFRHGRAAPRN
jgi:hypothetical protein